MKKLIKVVVTGGPSGGKTTLIETIKKELGSSVAVVPEAASILYRGGFPRLKSVSSTVHAQRAIFAVQSELEDLVASENKKARLLVCDRGSLDGIAYWPKSENDFFKSLHSSQSRELKRYDWVIHLDTAMSTHYDRSNPIRTESFKEAQRLNERVKFAWRKHPHRLVVAANRDFLSKITLALTVVSAILEGRSSKEIDREILS